MSISNHHQLNLAPEENYETDFSRILVPECIQQGNEQFQSSTNQNLPHSSTQNQTTQPGIPPDDNDSESDSSQKNNSFPNQIYVDIENNVIWNDIEGSFQPVPMYLRRCMIFAGFDNYFSIADLTEKDIQEVETLIRNNFKSLVHHTTRDESGNLMNYFHIYADTPDQFAIVKGHQKLLMRVKEYVSRKGSKYFLKLSKSESGMSDDMEQPYCSTENVSNYQDYSEFPHSQNSHSVFRESSIKQEYGGDQMVYEEDEDGGGEYTVLVQDKLVKIGSIAKARVKLTEIANRWLHNFSKLKNIPIDKIETAKVSYHQTRGFLGMIPCNQCQHFIRISTQTLPNGSTRWITSNFTKHYTKHWESGQHKRQKSSPAGDSFDGKDHVSFDDHPAVSFGNSNMSM